MDEKSVSYLAFESTMARFERTNKRLWILIIILIAVILGTNAGWLYYESQWQTVESTVTQDVEATADDNSDINLNTVGGDYYGGESESKTNSEN